MIGGRDHGALQIGPASYYIDGMHRGGRPLHAGAGDVAETDEIS